MNEVIKLKNRDLYLCRNLKRAESFVERGIGLMFKDEMYEGYDGLLLKPCNSIHTFFMRFSIDVMFLDRKLRVVKIIKNMQPWRISGFYFKSAQVLEMNSQTIPEGIIIGDQLEILCIN